MRKHIMIGIGIAMLAGCAQGPMEYSSMGPGSVEGTIGMAEQKLAMAKEMNSEWRVIDKATGGSAQDLSKLLQVAKEKAEAGDSEEAIRLAKRVIQFSELGVAQAKAQKGAMPQYN